MSEDDFIDDEDEGYEEPPVLRVEIPRSFPRWAPDRSVKWIETFGPKWPDVPAVRLYVSLLTDPRMRSVWEWHETLKKNTRATDSALALLFDADKSTRLPKFPGNLSQSERMQYLEKVRKHAIELIELLSGTIYAVGTTDAPPEGASPIDLEKLSTSIHRDLADWGAEETGHIVGFFVDSDGVYGMPWHFPQSGLSSLLFDLVEWTHWDDGWDWGIRSSKPLERTKGKGVKVAYFTRSLFESLRRRGVTIPFTHLATLANVALNLSASEEVDEDSVRKQVRRYQSAKSREEREIPW